jgi:hypothetical protein
MFWVKRWPYEFIGRAGEGAVELILQDFIQLQLAGYIDVIAVIL